MTYKNYELSIWEICFTGLISVGTTGVIAFLFYRSWWGMIILPLVFLFLKKAEEKRRLKNRKEQLHKEFMEGLKALNSALQAGYSIENAWKETEREIEALYGKDSYVHQELMEINRLVRNNVPIEQLIMDFALRTGIDDIIQFAQVMEYGKRSGANWNKIIERTIYRIQERYETKREVEVILAGKKMEIGIMCVIPLFLLLFLQITASDYMQVLYHNLFGVLCMSIALAGYIGAIVLAGKTIQIQV